MITQDNVDSWDGASPLPTLYSKTATGATQEWTVWIVGYYVHCRWGQSDGAMQQSNFVCTPKNSGRANETSAPEQARLEAISLWKKKLKAKYHMSAQTADVAISRKPMLAKSFKDRGSKIVWPATLQPKYDGVRCLAYWKDGEVFLQSRGGDPYNVAHIIEELTPVLPADLILDGELYVHGTSLQQINSLVKRPQPESLLLVYVVYDCIHEDKVDVWPTRHRELKELFEGIPPLGAIAHSQSWEVNNEEQVKGYHDLLVQSGFEGAIVRLHRGMYRFGYRSSDLLKYKEFQDAEFEITGWSPGKGKFKDMPIFRCVTEEGKVFDVTPKGTEEERKNMLRNADAYLHKMLMVRYFDMTDDGIPHFPVGICVRDTGT